MLIVMDGWGDAPASSANAISAAHTPNVNGFYESRPYARLRTSGEDVGLPEGQMGNSEVGHLNIGAGRVVAMDLGAIDLAIEDGSFAKNEALLGFVDKLKATGGAAHLLGVISNGGVHGHIVHVLAAARAIAAFAKVQTGRPRCAAAALLRYPH